MKVAIIHYWLVNNRGGEKVLEAICEIFPDADIFTHVYHKEAFTNSNIASHNVTETFIAKLPFAKKAYQSYLPLMPLALEGLDLSDYDLIISSESGPAKGIIPPPGIPHVCYCHSPMRYAWDMYHDYKKNAGRIKRLVMPLLLHYLRRWDQLNSTQVTHFISNSSFVAKRIKSYYGREAIVIHPPVSCDEFRISNSVGDYYLFLGQLVDYKKADLAVEAFNQSGKKLIVVGEGEQCNFLKKIAKPNIEIRGRLPFNEMKILAAQCKALIFPGIEDFGIVPLEVMSAGRPVIAFNKGGATETVIDGFTGVLFNQQSPECLNDAVSQYEDSIDRFDSEKIRRHAQSFNKSNFKANFTRYIKNTLNENYLPLAPDCNQRSF